jgi:hypothetical protein
MKDEEQTTFDLRPSTFDFQARKQHHYERHISRVSIALPGFDMPRTGQTR